MRNSIRSGLTLTVAAVVLGACALTNPDERPRTEGTQSGFDGNTREALLALKVSGNTYDRQNRLGVTYPEAERINVSYRFEPLSDTDTAPIPLPDEGRVWWYKTEGSDDPVNFTGLHLVHDSEAGVTDEPGSRVEMASRSYKARQYCTGDAGQLPAAMARYVEELQSLGAGIDGDFYLRHFESQDDSGDALRTDIVYVEDLSAMGTNCTTLGAPGEPVDDAAKDVYDGLRQRAEHSIEIMS